MLRTENVVKIYDPKRPEVKALAGISLNFPEKGMVFVVGKSGSGKSTLMNMLGCLDSPSSGEVYIDGRADKDNKSQRVALSGAFYLGIIRRMAYEFHFIAAFFKPLSGRRFSL